MKGDKQDKPGAKPPGGMERTVFVPSGAIPAPAPPPSRPQPGGDPLAVSPTPSNLSRPSAIPAGTHEPGQSRAIQIGDVLNHIFEVKRFIARGGMGEVFEGINVNSDERVAIKVMLPSLAADANVLAMFRKEARTLTRLSHPALVQYRVLAQEPQLGVFYIATEFVDGKNLSDVIGELNPTTQDLIKLTRRLAEGLSAAHALGAIHRDIAPDNVMLEGGLLTGAKIIDFGIAKDLDPGSATIVGDGFAGKLNYVAPEQLGDFNRSVGPWTDIYSLGLVILAVASRKDVNMGGSLVDAVDKRRAEPDLSPAPPELRPLLEKMLKANPAERLASMGAVLEMLPGTGAKPAPIPPLTLPAKPQPTPVEKGAKPAKQEPEPAPPPASRPPVLKPELDEFAESESWFRKNIALLAGGAATIALVLGAGVYFGMPGPRKPAIAAVGAVTKGGGNVANPVEIARAALNAGLPSAGCSWLDITNVSATDQGVSVALNGVAGKPADAQGQIARFLAAKGLKVASIDFQEVSPIEATECGPLDALRQIRDEAGGRISVAQRQFEMSKLDSGEFTGKIGARAVVNFSLTDPTLEMALFGIEPSGKISQLTSQRSELTAASDDLGNNQYRLTIDIDHTGWSGLLLLTGKKPFDAQLLSGPPGSRGGDWAQRFFADAKERNWKSEMVWFKTNDDVPN